MALQLWLLIRWRGNQRCIREQGTLLSSGTNIANLTALASGKFYIEAREVLLHLDHYNLINRLSSRLPSATIWFPTHVRKGRETWRKHYHTPFQVTIPWCIRGRRHHRSSRWSLRLLWMDWSSLPWLGAVWMSDMALFVPCTEISSLGW